MESKNFQPRPFLRIMFECCSIYQRIYRDPSGESYQGRCPRCLRSVRFRVAPNGTRVRVFAVH
ncbi:MAG: hypothetical protein V3S29_07580 [bacterium]